MSAESRAKTFIDPTCPYFTPIPVNTKESHADRTAAQPDPPMVHEVVCEKARNPCRFGVDPVTPTDYRWWWLEHQFAQKCG